jgi:Flp pilus assembly protein TadD
MRASQRVIVRSDRLGLLAGALEELESGRFSAVTSTCQRLLAVAPRDVEAKLLLGLALGAQGRLDEAMPLLDAVARTRPGHAHPCRDLAELLVRLGRPAEAAAQFRVWLAQAPADARTHHALGLVLAELGEIEAAISHLRQAVAIDPVPAAGWSNLGMLLKIERRFDEAIAAHDAAVLRAPEDPQIRVNRAVALLQAGRMTEAWRDYEWRLRQPGHTRLPLARLLPDIAGLDLSGRTVLITHEEGFGDTLQFVRYVPLLAARGARVVLAVPRELERLLGGLAGVSEMCPFGATLPRFEYHCPVFSLPRAFGTTMETIPGETPYLSVDPGLASKWERRLPSGGRRVGLVWAGQARPWLPGFSTLDGRRSAGLAAFAPLTGTPGVCFLSLQIWPAAAQTPPAGLVLHDPMPAVDDFADTAAIIAGLDLVVSVDTAVVHLAGALGKPVFLLDRYDNCWRWFSGREDSPWYPGLRIFRQERLGDWAAPMRRVTEATRGIAS